MTPQVHDEAVRQTVRRARYFFYLLGGCFAGLAIVLDHAPALARVLPAYSAKACGIVAIVLLSIGRFASDDWVRRCERLLRRRT